MALLRKVGWNGGVLLGEVALALTLRSVTVALMSLEWLARALWAPELRPPRPLEGKRRALCFGRRPAARRLPEKTICFHKGLDYHLMIRRLGIATAVRPGTRQEAEGAVAHRGSARAAPI